MRRFLASLVGSGSWISSLAETPVSTHTRIWPFSRSEVQTGGSKPLFSLWGIQHERSVCSSRFGQMWTIYSSTAPPPHTQLRPTRPRLLVNSLIQKGGGGAERRAWLPLHQQLSSCQECETFPKEIPPPPGKRGRKPWEFWHISVCSGSEREEEESEAADWTAVSQVCEQHGGAAISLQHDLQNIITFPKMSLHRLQSSASAIKILHCQCHYFHLLPTFYNNNIRILYIYKTTIYKSCKFLRWTCAKDGPIHSPFSNALKKYACKSHTDTRECCVTVLKSTGDGRWGVVYDSKRKQRIKQAVSVWSIRLLALLFLLWNQITAAPLLAETISEPWDGRVIEEVKG